MQDDFNISSWQRKLVMESLEENNEVKKETSKDNNFSKAEDNLYKKVTGENPKASTKNKFRNPIKEGDIEIFDRMEGLSNINDLKTFQDKLRILVTEWLHEGFEKDEVKTYVSNFIDGI